MQSSNSEYGSLPFSIFLGAMSDKNDLFLL